MDDRHDDRDAPDAKPEPTERRDAFADGSEPLDLRPDMDAGQRAAWDRLWARLLAPPGADRDGKKGQD